MPIVGAHVSAAGGLVNTITNAERIGADAIQFFGSSPRAWKVFYPSSAAIAAYKAAYKKSALQGAFLHAPYLINLGTPKKYLFEASVQNLQGHLTIAHLTGAQGVIFHVGSTVDHDDLAKAEKQVIGALRKILKAVPGKTQLIIENAAGGGSKIGATPDQVARLLEGVNSPRMKVCIDTQHAFAAGQVQSYTPPHIAEFLDRWFSAIGKNTLVALHVNDSKTEFNSHHDRHENIGQGSIGLAGFKNLAKEKRVNNLPWLLEVPGFDNEGPDAKNISLLKKCFH